MTKNEILAQISREKAKLRMIDPIQPHEVDMSLEVIIGLVRQLADAEGRETTAYVSTISALTHTKNKEGRSIEYYYREANRPGAARKRQQELQENFTKLLDRIDRETFSLFRS